MNLNSFFRRHLRAPHVAMIVAAALGLGGSLFSEEEKPAAPAPGPTLVKQEAFSFIQMCDTQLGMGGYEHDVQTFKAAVERINAMKADFVVICGDLVNKADDKSFKDFNDIRAGFQLPCYCAAGNHDVENEPTAESLKRYREKIGKDYYSFEHKGFTVVVANTQLWKVQVAVDGESDRHHAWFAKTLRAAKAKESPVIVVVHYPLFLKTPDEKETYFSLPLKKRKEILGLCEENGVVAVLGGHTHRWMIHDYKGILLVNGETTSKNFDKRPMGFRAWEVGEDRKLNHRFVALKGMASEKAEPPVTNDPQPKLQPKPEPAAGSGSL